MLLTPEQLTLFQLVSGAVTMSAKIAKLSDKDSYDALMHATYSAPQDIKDMVAKVCGRWHAAFTAVQAATATAMA